VLRIVDELDEPLGCELIYQPLHTLTAGRSHLGDLRHGERTTQREASRETERAAAPAGDEPCFLTEGRYSEEALGHFEHHLGDSFSLTVNGWARARLSAHRSHVGADAIAVPFVWTSFSG